MTPGLKKELKNGKEKGAESLMAVTVHGGGREWGQSRGGLVSGTKETNEFGQQTGLRLSKERFAGLIERGQESFSKDTGKMESRAAKKPIT